MSVEINIQFIFKNRARMRVDIDAYVDEDWDPMSMGLSDSEIKTISTGEQLLKLLYLGCFPNCEGDNWIRDDDFHVRDSKGQLNHSKVLELNSFSKIDSIIVKSRYEADEGFNFSDTTVIDWKNCPFINADSLYSAEELAKKRVNLPNSLVSIGEDAFSGCDQLVLNVLEGSAAKKQLEKHGVAHNVIHSNTSTGEPNAICKTKQIEVVGKVNETLVWMPYFRALRLATKNKVYILHHEFEEHVMESDERIFFDPDDYMPEIRDAKIIWGEDELNTIPALLAGLYFVLSDKIDFEILKTVFSLITKTISPHEAINICLNCHNTGFPNAFPKGAFDKLKVLNVDDYIDENLWRETVLQQIFSVFDQRIPHFEETIETFVVILKDVKSMSDILFVDAVEGIDGEHELTDEEMWKTTHKLDFYALDLATEESKLSTRVVPDAKTLNSAQKAAENEKQRSETEDRKRLEEEDLKRKEAEEQKRREEEERKQKEAEARRIAEEKAKAEAEARRLADEKYQADLKVWEQTCENIKKQREQTVAERLAVEKAALEQVAQKDYDTSVSAATNRKKTAQQNKADAELRLSKLGLFKFTEKNAMKEAILQAEAEITAAEKDLEQAKQMLSTTFAAIPAKVSAKESAIRKSVEEELALPPKPAKANQ